MTADIKTTIKVDPKCLAARRSSFAVAKTPTDKAMQILRTAVARDPLNKSEAFASAFARGKGKRYG